MTNVAYDPTTLWAIPRELTALSSWVAWTWGERGGTRTKIPINPRTGRAARVNDPATWASASLAEAAVDRWELAGVGVVLTGSEGLVGLDLDHCIEDGHTLAWAEALIRRFRSYTEITPSGCGYRIYVRGALPDGGRQKGDLQIYDRDRYFTVTGLHVEGTPFTIEERQSELDALHRELFPPLTNAHRFRDVTKMVCADDEVLAKARHARNGAKFDRLWSGDGTGYTSASEADLALCSVLAYWTDADADQIDRLFRSSGRMRPKWDAPDGKNMTYGSRTIHRALRR